MFKRDTVHHEKRREKHLFITFTLLLPRVCHIHLQAAPPSSPFPPSFLPPPPVFLGYDGSELNMELFWILLFSSVCPLTWSQGVYGRNSLIFKCVSVQLYSKYIFIFIFTTLWFVGRSKKWHFKRFKRRASGRSSAN